MNQNNCSIITSECNTQEKAVVNNVMIYLCGWSFETLLEKCGIGIDENGEPIIAEYNEDE